MNIREENIMDLLLLMASNCRDSMESLLHDYDIGDP